MTVPILRLTHCGITVDCHFPSLRFLLALYIARHKRRHVLPPTSCSIQWGHFFGLVGRKLSIFYDFWCLLLQVPQSFNLVLPDWED